MGNNWNDVLAKDTNGYAVKLNNVDVLHLPERQGVAHSFWHNDGRGNQSWQPVDYAWLVGSPIAGGLDTQVQFNDGGVLSGDSTFTFDKTTKALSLGGDILFSLGADRTIKVADQTTGDVSGYSLYLEAGAGHGAFAQGGYIYLRPGGTPFPGLQGSVVFQQAIAPYYSAFFDTTDMTADRSFIFPNEGGTFLLGNGVANRLAVWQSNYTVTNLPNSAGYLHNDGAGVFTFDAAGLGFLGNASAQYHVPVSGATPFAYAESGWMLDGTSGGKTVLGVASGKTLTLTSADTYNLTIPKTGTAATGTGTAGYISAWVTDANTLTNSIIRDDGTTASIGVAPVANQILTLNTATATSTALVIQTSDDSTTTYLMSALSSTGLYRFAIRGDGRVGIGPTSSYLFGAYNLQVLGTQNASAVFAVMAQGTADASFSLRAAGTGTTQFSFVNWSGGSAGKFSMTDDNAGKTRYTIDTIGRIVIGNGISPGAKLDILGETNDIQLRVSGFTSQTNPILGIIDAVTGAGIHTLANFTALASGAANDGGALAFQGKSSTTAAQVMGLDQWFWVDATHASRKARRVFNVYDTAIREGLRIEASGSAPMIGFLGANAIVQEANTVALDTLLVDYGLRASGGYANFATTIQPRAGTTAANTAPLKFTTQASGLTSVEQGAMELIGNSLQFTQLARRRGVAMTQNTRTADFTLAASDGSAESAAVATSSHGANYLEVGKMEEIVLIGTMSQRLNPNANLTVRVKYAGSTILTFATAINNAIATNSSVLIRVYCTCRTTGGTGTMQINAVFEVNGTATDPQAASLVTIDTTTAQDTTVTFQWGTDTDAANTITIHQARVLCVEPSK